MTIEPLVWVNVTLSLSLVYFALSQRTGCLGGRRDWGCRVRLAREWGAAYLSVFWSLALHVR